MIPHSHQHMELKPEERLLDKILYLANKSKSPVVKVLIAPGVMVFIMHLVWLGLDRCGYNRAWFVNITIKNIITQQS
jgi:hypothetical protein